MLRIERFGGGDIEAGGVHLAGVERIDQRLRIDHTAAGRIDDDDTVLHSSERRRVEQVPGLIGERGVHRDDPALGQDHVEIDLFVFGDLHIGVADDDAHVHCGAHAGDSTADPAMTDHPDGGTAQLDALVRGVEVLSTSPQAGDIVGGELGRRHEQAHRVLGGRDRRRVGCVAHDDTLRGGGIEIDGVEADARPRDHLEHGALGDAFGGPWRRAGDRSATRRKLGVVRADHLPVRAEEFVESGRKRAIDEDAFRHGCSLVEPSSRITLLKEGVDLGTGRHVVGTHHAAGDDGACGVAVPNGVGQ